MYEILNKGSTKKFFSILVMLLMILPALLLQVPVAQAAGTPAGTTIGNQATATYKDSLGNTFTSTSNQVVTTITAVYSFLLTPDSTQQASQDDAEDNPGQSQNATPGAIVYFPYTLTNTGNSQDSYTFAVEQGSTTDRPNEIDPVSGSLKVYVDVNGNGVVDVGDTQISTLTLGTGTQIGPVAADSQLKLVVQYQVPTSAGTGDVINVDLQADSVGGTAVDTLNYNKTNILNDAVVSVTKAVSSATIDPGGDLTYTFTFSNTGNATATNIVLTDLIPANTDFLTASQSAAEGAFAFSNNGGTSYVYNPSGTTDATVTHIRFTLGSLAAANTRTASFKVRVEANAPATTIPDFGEYTYLRTGAVLVPASGNIDTNTVITTVNKKVATVISDSGPTRFDPPGAPTHSVFGTDPLVTDKTVQDTASAGTYVYFKNVITNNGNADDTFNITTDSSTFPASASFSYFKLTDTTTGSNNTSPLLDTNSDSVVDTGVLASGASTTIVTRVFIPGTAVNSTNATTLSNAALSGATTIDVASVGTMAVGDQIAVTTISGISYHSITVIAGNTLTLASGLSDDANNGAAVTHYVPMMVAVKASSSNGGTAIGATPTLTLNDTTRNVLARVLIPAVDIRNVIAGSPSDTTVSLTASANGTTVTFPLNVLNPGGSNDTFNLTHSVTGIAGASVQFFNTLTSTTVNDATALLGDSSITLTSAAGFTAGDKIVINGQTLTVGSVSVNTVTFASGQTLFANVSNGATVVEPGSSPITSTSVIAPSATTSVVAVVTVPVDSPPYSTANNAIFTATSTNDSSKSDSITDSLVIPDFRDFTLVANRIGSAPAGGVLFYSHTLTNTGNTTEDFTLSIPTTGANGFTYQILTLAGAPLSTVTGLLVGDSITFQVKVTIPAGTASGTVETQTLTATETTSSKTATNNDETTVVSGFVQLIKSVETYTFGTNGLDGTIRDLDTGTPGVQTGYEAEPGNVLEYTINYSNIGSLNALEVIIKDQIPTYTTYVPGSMTINAAVDPLPANNLSNGDATDNADFNVSTSGAVTFYVGSGANGTAGNHLGGTVVPGATGAGFVKFRVRVNP